MIILDIGSSDCPVGDINIDRNLNFKNRGKAQIQIQADGYYLPFPNNLFSLVYSSHVIEHVENPYAFLREMVRVSKKYVLIKTPNAHCWRFIINDDLHGFGNKKIAHRYQGFSRRCLIQMFMFAGLEVLKIVYLPITDPYSNRFSTRRLDFLFKWVPQFNFREIQILGVKKCQRRA